MESYNELVEYLEKHPYPSESSSPSSSSDETARFQANEASASAIQLGQGQSDVINDDTPTLFYSFLRQQYKREQNIKERLEELDNRFKAHKEMNNIGYMLESHGDLLVVYKMLLDTTSDLNDYCDQQKVQNNDGEQGQLMVTSDSDNGSSRSSESTEDL